MVAPDLSSFPEQGTSEWETNQAMPMYDSDGREKEGGQSWFRDPFIQSSRYYGPNSRFPERKKQQASCRPLTDFFFCAQASRSGYGA